MKKKYQNMRCVVTSSKRTRDNEIYPYEFDQYKSQYFYILLADEYTQNDRTKKRSPGATEVIIVVGGKYRVGALDNVEK